MITDVATDGSVKLKIDVPMHNDVSCLTWPDFKLTRRTPYHLQLRACAV